MTVPSEHESQEIREERIVLTIVRHFLPIVERGLWKARATIARWTTPISHAPTFGLVTDLARSKAQLVAENLFLRRQLIVLNRTVKRPSLTRTDRIGFVLLASLLPTWRDALLIV